MDYKQTFVVDVVVLISRAKLNIVLVLPLVQLKHLTSVSLAGMYLSGINNHGDA